MADNITTLRDLEKQAEAAYDRMYDAGDAREAASCYAQAKDAFIEAMALALRLPSAGDAARLEARLAHVKAVYRSQFA